MRFRKNTLLIVLLFLLHLTVYCTPRPAPFRAIFGWELDRRIGPRIAYSRQSHGSVEIGMHIILFSKPYENEWQYESKSDPQQSKFRPEGWWNAGLSFEFPFGNGAFVLGPKLFSEFNLGFLSTAINVTPYTDFRETDLRVTPEIGIGLLGYFGVRYGYNFS